MNNEEIALQLTLKIIESNSNFINELSDFEIGKSEQEETKNLSDSQKVAKFYKDLVKGLEL